MRKEVMLAARSLRESDLPLMERAVTIGKRDGSFEMADVFLPHERSRAGQAMRLSGMFDFSVVRRGKNGRPRQVATWRV